MAEVIDETRTADDHVLHSAPEDGAEERASEPTFEGVRVSAESCGGVIFRGWRSGTTTKALLLAGIVAVGMYVVGDLLSGLIYNSSRAYSFKDQWISELTALGSPVRPLMVAVITVHGLLAAAFAVGIWRAAGQNRALRWAGLLLLGAGAVGLMIHPFFPMTSRWMESSFTDTMHGVLSMVWGLIIFVAVALAAVAHRGWFRVYSIATLLVLIGFGAASGIAIRGIEQNDTPWAGAFERINAYALMAWFAVLAVTVMRHSLGETPPEERVTEVPQTRGLTRQPSLGRRRSRSVAARFLSD